MTKQIIFLIPSPTIEFKSRFASLGDTIFIDEVKDFQQIDELKLSA